MAKLCCAVFGKASVVSVEVPLSGTVEELQHAIFYKFRYQKHYKSAPCALNLFLAKTDRSDGSWLKDDDRLETLLQWWAGTDQFLEMRPLWRLDEPAYFGAGFEPEYKEIHMLVEPPREATPLCPY